MTRPVLALALFILFALVVLVQPPASGTRLEYPATRQEDVTERFHGETIADPYRWLEQQNSAETQAWIRAQNVLTQTRLRMAANRPLLAQRLTQLSLIGSVTAPLQRGQRLFFLQRTSNQEQASLIVRELTDQRDRVLLNPNVMDPQGLTAIDWFFPSPDGRYVAFGLSSGGTELSTLQVADVSGWRLLPDKINHTRACSVAWLPDSRGFYYTRYPAPGSVPAGEENYHRHVYFHALGTDPSSDPKVFGADRPKEEWTHLQISPNGRYLVIRAEQGWAKTALWLLDTTAGGDTQSLETGDAIYAAILDDDYLYVRTNDGAPRFRLMRAELSQPKREHWTELVPEREDPLQEVTRIGDRLVLCYLHDAAGTLQVIQRDGGTAPAIRLPAHGTVLGLGGDSAGTDFYFAFSDFLLPVLVQHINFASRATEAWAHLRAPGLEAGNYQVELIWYPSKDGTKIPMRVVHRRGVSRDGMRPTLLYGYGGFNLAQTPRFRSSFIPFLEAGGVVAVANLRGGSEFGEAWHEAGMLGKKQNVIDDFIAAAEALIEQKYTSAEKLAIQGGSNGGLLVAAAATQRPELFRAVVCQVPLTDMLRYHRFGIARLWLPEYGDPENPEEFGWLRAYSPYHNVKEGTAYPAMLLTAAAGDSRVDPLHACKMAARLQAASTSNRPVLLRLEADAGHGAGKARLQRLAEEIDILSFLFQELGMTP